MKLTSFFVFVLLFALPRIQAQPSATVEEYIQQYKQLAVDEMLRTGVPASIKLAQGIHETQAGQSDLVLRSNNHFGIKCKTSWVGNKVFHDDDAAGECFRAYNDPSASYRDHSDFLRANQRYALLFQLDPMDYKGWAYGLKKAGYATNIKYSQLLIRIIETYNLQEYTLIAMGKKPPTKDLWVGVRPLPESAETVAAPAMIYPTGVFKINGCDVTVVKAGVSLLAVAEQHRLSLPKLLEFNDMTEGEGDVLIEEQLIYLQRKPKHGNAVVHTVADRESLYTIAQAEGIRYGSLLELNHLQPGMEPAVGERLYLKEKAPAQPLLAGAKRPIARQELSYITNAQPVAYVSAPAESSVGSSTQQIHRVQDKETLYGISKKYGVSLEQLKAWNQLKSSGLRKGQELIIYSN